MQILSKHLEFCKKRKGETESYCFYCCHTVFVSAFLVHGPVTQATFHDTFLLCHLVPFAFVCVCFIIPCQCVTAVVAFNATTAVTHCYLITHGYVTPYIMWISGRGLANYTISTREWKKSCMAMHLQVHFVFGVSVQKV